MISVASSRTPPNFLAVFVLISHLFLEMKSLSNRQVLTFVLGVFLALGPILSQVQATEMAVTMAMLDGMPFSEQGGCDGCGGDNGMVNSGSCLPVCTTVCLAVLPAGISLKAVPTPKMTFVNDWSSPGLSLSPDPHPPRLIDIG